MHYSEFIGALKTPGSSRCSPSRVARYLTGTGDIVEGPALGTNQQIAQWPIGCSLSG